LLSVLETTQWPPIRIRNAYMLCLLGVVFSVYTKLTLTRAPLILKRNIIQHILIYFGGKPSLTSQYNCVTLCVILQMEYKQK